jgi:TonB family protein
MTREIVVAFSLTLAAACAIAQAQQSTETAPAAAPAAVAESTIHYKSPGVIAPELISVNGKFDAIDHCKKMDGDEQLLIAVDRTGTAQTIKVLKSLGNDLDAMARHIVELDKFKPGTVEGAPAIVALADDMKLQACLMEKKNEGGQKQKYLELRSVPEQTFDLIEAPKNAPIVLPPKPGTPAWNAAMHSILFRVGGGVSAPVLIHRVDPEYTDEARQAKFQGVCIVMIIVDTNGIPQNPRVLSPVGMGMDEKVVDAVKQFRFKPAMKDGTTPVPVMITIQVNFMFPGFPG